MIFSRLTRFSLVFFLVLTVLGLVFQFTLAVGCLMPGASSPSWCPTDRQNQILPAESTEAVTILYLALPAIPTIPQEPALLYSLDTRVTPKPLLCAQDITHPPTS